MRDANNCFPSSNRASVVITSSLYDRRALDTTSALPLLNSLTHLTYLTSTSPRIREILTLDGGLERLLHILRNSSIPRPPPPPPDIYGLSISPAIPASTGLLSADRAIAYRFSLAFQCVSNVGVRGSEQIRTRVVQAGVLDVVAQVLEVWLRSRGLSTEAGSTGMPGAGGSSSGSRRDHTSRRRALAVPDARAPPPPSSTTVEIIPSFAAPPPSPVALIPPRATTTSLPARTQLETITAPSQPSAAPPPSSDPVATEPSSSSSSLVALAPRSAAYPSAPGSVLTSGDEEAEMNDAESGTGNEVVQDEDEDEMDVDHALSVLQNIAVAMSDAETGRLAELASASLQTMASGGDLAERARRRVEVYEASQAASDNRSDPTPRAPDSQLPFSIPSRSRPSPTRTSSVGTDNSADSSTFNAVASSSTSTSNLNPASISRPRPVLSQVSSSGQVSGTSSPGASNISTPMGTPTGTNARERSGTLLGRPAPHLAAARRRNRRGDRAASGNDSGTTGGEDDETVDGDHGGDDGDEERGPAQQNETSPSMGIQVGIVEGEDSATDIEAHLDQLEGNVDLQMGAPPGAPGAVTPRTAADATPRQGFLPLDATGATPGGAGVEATPGGGRGQLPVGPAPTPPTVRIQGGLFPPANLMAAPPAIVALATAQATQRTLRDLSLEGNVMTPSETTYRDDDILLSLQLLAYLSKYPHVRQAFHRPREPFHPNLNLDVQPGDPPLPMRPALSTTPNIFSLVERFTFRPSPTDPTIPQLPEEIVYWAGVIMRNACRKDESRGGIRQCANMTCGKWETLPRQFAKCRRCRKAKYCSKDCQSKAWSEGHRFWCSQRGEGEGGSHGEASNPSSVASGTPNPAAAPPPPPTDTDGLPQPPHHHHHHHHNLPPQPRAPTDPALRRQVQNALAARGPGDLGPGGLPTRPRGPAPVVEPDIRRRQEFRNPMMPIGRATTPASEPMDVDEEPAPPPPPRPSPLSIPTVVEPRRTWGWLGSNPPSDPSTTSNPSAAGPSNSNPNPGPSSITSSLRRRDSPSPSGRLSPLPASNDPSPTSRSSILAPAGGALARAFNFAVPRLNLGGGGDAGPSLSPSTARDGGSASGGSGGDERTTRRGFFRGLSGGSNGSGGEESRPRRGSSGGSGDVEM